MSAQDFSKMQAGLEEIARRCGLSFYPIFFERLADNEMSEVVAYNGYPSHYSHFKFGAEIERYRATHKYGLSHVYELVLPTNPCWAYLSKSADWVVQKTVVAHVIAHADFFHNNIYFRHTDGRSLEQMGHLRTLVDRFSDEEGRDVVEDFLSTLFSLTNLIGPSETLSDTQEEDGLEKDSKKISLMPAYIRDFLYRPEDLEERREQQAAEDAHRSLVDAGLITPPHPTREILEYLLQYAPLREWEQQLLAGIIFEAKFFTAHRMTKIMNEGWAAYWHNKLMIGEAKNSVPPQLASGEVVRYCDFNGRILAPHKQSINPYALGRAIFERIEERWDKGMFGQEWEKIKRSGSRAEIDAFDRKVGLGRQKIFEVRRLYSDRRFLEEFFDETVAQNQKLFLFGENSDGNQEVMSRTMAKIKSQLLFQLVNNGSPTIWLDDANFNEQGALFLRHEFGGVNLDEARLKGTLKALWRVWRRPVYLETWFVAPDQEREIDVVLKNRESNEVIELENPGEIEAHKYLYVYTGKGDVERNSTGEKKFFPLSFSK